MTSLAQVPVEGASSPSTGTIHLRNVTMTYHTRQQEIVALQDVSLSVAKREFVTLIGPSGCGKSTILRLVADILKPTAGEIKVHGRSPSEAREERSFAFVFQSPVLLPWRSIQSNVQLALEVMRRGSRQERLDRAVKSLDLVGLAGFENVRPHELSGGMKQRAAIARALTLDPPLLLMDEPFGALDEITRDQMNLELLRVWTETTASVLFVTHSIQEAVFLSDRIIIMSSRPGRVTETIDIDLPRPRNLDIQADSHFHELVLRVREALYAGHS